MNRRMVINMTGKILAIEAALFMLPFICSVIYKEKTAALSLLAAAGIALLLGALMMLLSRPRDKNVFAREGFAIVSLAWLCVSLVGSLPFVISREIPNFIDAFFETVSGFTTTGASILTNIEGHSHGLLFWRSFTHWIGGMGVLVFVMAILPTDSGRSIHIMRAEVPGPTVGKLVPKIKQTARILYLIYIALTVVMVSFLLAGGMDIFESLVHTFGTAGTGGFGIKNDSLTSYSPYLQWVIAVFMLLFGINFNLYYLILIKKFSSAIKSSELWCYIGIIFAATVAICANISNMCLSFGEALRHSFFQVSSIITTSGFVTTNINIWPGFSKMIILVLMFIGGCAGSTAGGLKVSRVMLLVKALKRDLKKMLHPRSVGVVKHEGKTVDDITINNSLVYLVVYFLIFFVALLLVSLEPYTFETVFSSVASCFNNVGPAFGDAAANYASFSCTSKIVFSFAMLFGRLEIFPLLLAFSPSTWKRK